MATGVGALVGVVGALVVVLGGVVGVVVAANTVATPTRSVAAEEKLTIFTSFIVTSHVGDLALIMRMKESKLNIIAV